MSERRFGRVILNEKCEEEADAYTRGTAMRRQQTLHGECQTKPASEPGGRRLCAERVRKGRRSTLAPDVVERRSDPRRKRFDMRNRPSSCADGDGRLMQMNGSAPTNKRDTTD
uniref:Uncharacterized protein n=1 Tax=Plectus sambesii TaxID=2011161 RepID=A0A914VMY4_9BILA